LVVPKSIFQFSSKVDDGVVIDYLDASGKSLLAQSQYFRDRPITLIVSAGALPSVSGDSVNAAESALAAVGLTNVEQGSQVYNDTVPKGSVIGIDPQKNSAGVGRVFQVGDSNPVYLMISRGPQPVLVPSVDGMDWTDAKAKLSAAGFKLNYDKRADSSLFSPTVASTNPAGGTMAPHGSTITVTFVSG
jgi:beta-lactam-binding protein with PASTA domain